MYSRGQFALIGKTTIKALRLYEELGLLVPERIDQSNQYKYYAPSQIEEIILINQLKSFGFSLEEIKQLKLEREVGILKRSFLKRLVELEREIHELVRRKEELTHRIQLLDTGKEETDLEQEYPIILVQLEQMLVASCREQMALSEVGRLVGKVYELLHRFSLQAVDSHLVIFHSDENSDSNEWELEVCIPVNQTVKTEEFATKMIFGATYVKTTQRGGFTQTGKAHARVIDWIQANGYQINGAPLEKYLTKQQAVFNPSSLEIEIYYPVQPRTKGDE